MAVSCASTTLETKMEEAEALVGMGKHQAALDLYDQVAKGCPSYERCAEVLIRIGDIKANLAENPRDVLDAYGRVIELFPLTDAGRIAHERRASVYERYSDYLGAAEEYASLLQYFPSCEQAPRYLLALGETYIAMGNYEQARIELRGLLKAMGYDPSIRQEALFAYAESYFLEGRLGLAERSYRILIDEFPNSPLVPEARMKIATCQEERGFLGDAVKTLSRARREYPNKPVIEDRLDAMHKRGKESPPQDVMRQKEEAKKEVVSAEDE